MSDREKKDEKPATDLEKVEVEELDDKNLEEASGGQNDINQFQCNC